jgi:membrane protease YdiL (CAAX protease family)
MTAISIPGGTGPRAAGRPGWLEAALLVVGLGAIVIARTAAYRAGLDPLALGAAFGAGVFLLAAAGGAKLPQIRRLASASAAGAVVGLLLIAAGLAGPALDGVGSISGLGRPAAPFVPWAAIIVGVAVAEEAVLRGVLFDRLRRGGGGLLVAVLVTTVVFALMHVPLYGWHVVPLDLAVGLALGGLRAATSGVAAPAVAHAVADLATWWL